MNAALVLASKEAVAWEKTVKSTEIALPLKFAVIRNASIVWIAKDKLALLTMTARRMKCVVTDHVEKRFCVAIIPS